MNVNFHSAYLKIVDEDQQRRECLATKIMQDRSWANQYFKIATKINWFKGWSCGKEDILVCAIIFLPCTAVLQLLHSIF